MRYAFFRGCMIPIKLPYLESISRRVLGDLGIELVDVDEFTCCPDPIIFGGVDRLTWLSIAARNICLAEERGLDIITLCNGCSQTLRTANETLKSDIELKDEVNKILSGIGHTFLGKIKVKHFLQVLTEDVGIEEIEEKVKSPLRGLRVATHTGCHLTNPAEVMRFDDPEDPTVLERLVAPLGAEAVDYDLKTLCCGVSYTLMGNRKTSNALLRDKLMSINRVGAQCIVTGCPFCFQQFDLGQLLSAKEYNLRFKVPVLFYTQLLGLAMGYDLKEVGYTYHKIHDGSFEKMVEPRVRR